MLVYHALTGAMVGMLSALLYFGWYTWVWPHVKRVILQHEK